MSESGRLQPMFLRYTEKQLYVCCKLL